MVRGRLPSCVVGTMSCVGSYTGDDFIFTGDSLQLAWAESRLNEKLFPKRRAILRPDDGDDPESIGDLGVSVWISQPDRNRSRPAPSRNLAGADESRR